MEFPVYRLVQVDRIRKPYGFFGIAAFVIQTITVGNQNLRLDCLDLYAARSNSAPNRHPAKSFDPLNLYVPCHLRSRKNNGPPERSIR